MRVLCEYDDKKMTGGQTNLSFDSQEVLSVEKNKPVKQKIEKQQKLVVIEPTDDELYRHDLLLKSIKEKSGGKCLWIENEPD